MADEMERRRQARKASEQRAFAEAARLREKEKQKRKTIAFVIIGMLLLSTCCITSQCRSCEEQAALEEAQRAKVEAQKQRQQELAQKEKQLREAFDEQSPELEATLTNLEEAVEADDYETASAVRAQLINALEPFALFTTRAPEKLSEFRARHEKAAAWLMLKDAEKKLEESPDEALKLIESATAANSGLEGLADLRQKAIISKADAMYDQSREKGKAKEWIDAEKLLIDARALLEKHSGEEPPRNMKRLLKKIERRAARYKKRADKQREASRKQAAYRQLCGEPPKPDSWDGGVFAIERYVESTAHDPGSIDVENCTAPSLSSDNCWRIQCHVVGKNAFGAKVRNAGTFWIASGQVVKSEM